MVEEILECVDGKEAIAGNSYSVHRALKIVCDAI
jgi:hypothetical protein